MIILKRKGNKIALKITQKMRNGYAPHNAHIVINPKNFKDVALMLHDLKDLYGVPMDKAIEEYKISKDNYCFFA